LLVATVALLAGLQLVWSGTHSLNSGRAAAQARLGGQQVAKSLAGISRP